MLDSQPSLARWSWTEYALPTYLNVIIAAFSAGTAWAISDGSFKDKQGTSAWTIVDPHTSSILGLNSVPGHPDDQSAYRSKLVGLFGIVMVSNLLYTWAHITSEGFEVGCDGCLAVLNNAFDTWPLEPDDPHFDLLSALRTKIVASPLAWTTRHIPGHQDNDATVKLDFWAGQNIQMDNLAKISRMQQSSMSTITYPLANEGFQAWLAGKMNYSLVAASLT